MKDDYCDLQLWVGACVVTLSLGGLLCWNAGYAAHNVVLMLVGCITQVIATLGVLGMAGLFVRDMWCRRQRRRARQWARREGQQQTS